MNAVPQIPQNNHPRAGQAAGFNPLNMPARTDEPPVAALLLKWASVIAPLSFFAFATRSTYEIGKGIHCNDSSALLAGYFRLFQALTMFTGTFVLGKLVEYPLHNNFIDTVKKYGPIFFLIAAAINLMPKC